MTKSMLRVALAATAFAVAVPAQAVLIPVGSISLTPTPGLPAGQGTLLASQTFSGQAFSFAATFNQAVYRNDGGTLDFYFQVLRTGPGSVTNQEIERFTVAAFDNYLIDGYASGPDPDGAGMFIAAANPALANGTPSGSTTTFARSLAGDVLTTNFGANGLTGTENSATYIFRTSATAFNNLGTFGILDGSSLEGRTYQPTSAVPEPATWMMMLAGFGMVGAATRYRRRKTAVTFA